MRAAAAFLICCATSAAIVAFSNDKPGGGPTSLSPLAWSSDVQTRQKRFVEFVFLGAAAAGAYTFYLKTRDKRELKKIPVVFTPIKDFHVAHRAAPHVGEDGTPLTPTKPTQRPQQSMWSFGGMAKKLGFKS